MLDQTAQSGVPEEPLRNAAITRLRKKRDLLSHFVAYATVNAFLIGIWLFTTAGGFFWPIFPLLGWGIGLALHVWDVYGPGPLTEEKIHREMERLR